MRLKIKYLPNEITNNLYTFGKEWMTTSNTEYIGLYHTYVTGEIYSEGTWKPDLSVKLIPYEDASSLKLQYKNLKSINTTFITPIPYQAENSIKFGTQTIQRYFLQRKNNLENIIEIDSDQFDLYNTKQIDNNLFNGAKLTWTISGNVSDIISNGTKQLGVATKNKIAITTIEKQIPGISKKLSNLLEFYTDTEFTIPRDINLG